MLPCLAQGVVLAGPVDRAGACARCRPAGPPCVPGLADNASLSHLIEFIVPSNNLVDFTTTRAHNDIGTVAVGDGDSICWEARSMAEQNTSQNRTVFSVRLDGMAIPPEVSSRISAAIQRAVLMEFAELNLLDGFHVQTLSQMQDLSAREGGGGGTQGIAISADVPQREL